MTNGQTVEQRFERHKGPQPGLIGDVAALHGRYYATHWSFPTEFEAKVAREMGDMLQRFDPARDLVASIADGDRIQASVTLDGSDPDLSPGQGHLRWFIVDDALRGRGFGKRLLTEALAFARATGLRSVYLTTFRGLDAAASLYARAGFVVTDEREGRTWGRTVVEQRLEVTL